MTSQVFRPQQSRPTRPGRKQLQGLSRHRSRSRRSAEQPPGCRCIPLRPTTRSTNRPERRSSDQLLHDSYPPPKVIAHEICHSWTGNLVTNKTWEHSWLKEGHTVYLERRIGGRLFGEPFRHFQALGGWRELQNTINTLGDTSPFTNLIPKLNEVDPDVAHSSVPYEKGFALLFHLEQLLGGPDVFIGFLKAYIQQFAYKSAVTEDWKKFLYSYFKDKVDVLNKVDWNAWMHTPGMPPVKPTAKKVICAHSAQQI
ncbi:leukotriene A-4 hydrolase-like [Trachemys scripta elegans]|uniref:leukotriene A-4 hydrolase-like n=1 Tax=Trachemys scripta elegans TaxID=31138 RepID=UPI0015530926|nr:leukotriene A-4 hydrolase-like [Trachemys scripta elegans]XP_034629066.1 leukotriene A-4 hydrolase-like [Trachemys scripta elegans]